MRKFAGLLGCGRGPAAGSVVVVSVVGEGAVAVVVAFAVVAVRDEALWFIAVAVVVGQVAFVVDEARVWSGSLSEWELRCCPR